MSTRYSVVVTSYNYRQFVTEAVDGALAQTRAPAQIVVVDDGSTDGSAELLTQRGLIERGEARHEHHARVSPPEST